MVEDALWRVFPGWMWNRIEERDAQWVEEAVRRLGGFRVLYLHPDPSDLAKLVLCRPEDVREGALRSMDHDHIEGRRSGSED